MGKISKTLLSIVLLILVIILVSCSSNKNKENDVIEADNNKIEGVKENTTTNDESIKSDNIDKGLIIDEVNFGNVSYIIYKSEQDGLQRLYKKDENNNLKLFLEKNNIEIYENDSFFYVYYYSKKEEYRHNILLIDNFKNDIFKPCYKFNYSDFKFSKDNKYFAIVNGFYTMVFKGNNAIYNADISINPENSKSRRSKLFEALHIELSKEYSTDPNKFDYSMEFSEDSKTFFIHYSINNLSDIFLKINLDKEDSHIYLFDDHGTYNDKAHKFNPNTGDVLYVASNIYPYTYDENYKEKYCLPWSNNIEHTKDEADKFLYLRNIYTQEMFVIDKLETSNLSDYKYNFTKDNQIEINGKVITKDIKIQDNLVYAECKFNKIDSIEVNSNIISSVLNIDEEAASNIPKFIKNNYNVDSEVLQTLNYNDVVYAIVNIPDYYINYSDGYKKIRSSDASASIYLYNGSSIELWRYENGDCKRLLYYQTYFSIYNNVSGNCYLMISGDITNPGYIVKLDESNNILYEAKYKDFYNSPDGRYTLIQNTDESFAIVENDKIIIEYKIQGNDDINKFWFYTVLDQVSCWWDLEFNKLYVLLQNSINPYADIYCVDLINKNVKDYGYIKHNSRMENINKELSYIFSDNSVFTGSADSYLEKLYTDRKYYSYIYNLRTNEKICFTDYIIYGYPVLDNTLIKYNNGNDIDLTLDISQYVNKDRINYVKKIKDSIIESYNNSIKADNIELCLIFNTTQGKYQIVKINQTDNDSYYELWKINDNNFEKLFDKTDNIFLTNNQEFLCLVSNNGDLKIYDKNFDCIINENIYSEELLTRYNLESLSVPLYYIMKFDKNIFFPIKGSDNLADVVNVDLINKKISYIGRDLDCNYDNFAINPKMGYLIYQKGPSVVRYNKQLDKKEISFSDLDETLMLIDLMTNEETTIIRDELYLYFY